MKTLYLHQHPEFAELIQIVSQEKAIAPVLVEKDYWIMHCLYSLQKVGLTFQMKGGTSLSKGFKIINRFSEDIDILIEPPEGVLVSRGHNQNSNTQITSRKNYYDWLASFIHIDGVYEVKRDSNFDDRYYRSGGIRLFYPTIQEDFPLDLKEGILLEVGFDDITPTLLQTISSWVYDFALGKTEMIDNRAQNIPCYHPGYTLVEKLQTISTKFRKEQETRTFSENFMRHYYDVFCLLKNPEIQEFLETEAYHVHKERRFRTADNKDIGANEAFILSLKQARGRYEDQYNQSKSLYYHEKPSFDEILDLIRENLSKL